MIYRQTKNSAGADLAASIEVVIPPQSIVLVPTGEWLDAGFSDKEGIFYLLAARSSLAYKKGLLLANGVGIIDGDYKDEIKVMLYNSTSEPVTIEAGERIAQLIPTTYLPLFPSLDNDRNGGFGSTGA
jgi:dUTP pyrophosphatase